MNRHIEFTINRLTPGDGRAVIDGRVCKSPVRVGDVFTKIYGHSQRLDKSEWVAIEPGPTQAVRVRLVIESIESYGRLWDELSSGRTAKLTVTGDGLNRLSEGMILGDDNMDSLDETA